MRQRQGGQAFIIVLILLAIGASLIVPSLALISTSFQNSRILSREVKAMYAAEGAVEYVLWKLSHDNFGAEFTEDGQEIDLPFNICGATVAVTVVMRTLEGAGGTILATGDAIRPTKTVVPSTIDNDTLRTCTYTIRLEQLSENSSVGLDAIYDILPKTLDFSDYEPNSSYLKVDNGQWEEFVEPGIDVVGGQVRLRWPASGNFSSPIKDFEVRQVKQLKFEVTHNFTGVDKNSVLCNWVVLKPWDTLSGPQAPITVGSPANPGQCQEDGLLLVDKDSDPEVIQPGVVADIEYTVSITNQDGLTHQIQEIRDFLPPGFNYTDNSTSDLTPFDPQVSLEEINGVERVQLLWTTNEFPQQNAVSIASGETLTLTFWATTTKDVSGSYYNEVIVIPNTPVPDIFSQIGISQLEWCSNYSWNAGSVLVPYYDARADAEDVVIDANFGLIPGSIIIKSWQVQ